jgi:hypothetical protein
MTTADHDDDEQLDVDAATGERLDVFGPPRWTGPDGVAARSRSKK